MINNQFAQATIQHLQRALVSVVVALGISSVAQAAATITIVNGDGVNVGFNDSTPVAPVGGNTGATLGQQRLNAFQAAADKWGATLDSVATIRVLATWEALTCSATSAVLGSAGATQVFRDFATAPFAGSWYGKALTGKLIGADPDPASADIRARFNVNLGQPGCFTGTFFYLGLDNNHGANVDLVTVLTHEFSHGLGFQTFTNGATGAQLASFPSVWDRFLLDLSSGKSWFNMSNAERVASAVNSHKLAWNGPQVSSDVPSVLSFGTPVLKINSPSVIAGNYDFGAAVFGPAVTAAGITGDVVLADDGVAPVTNGCEAFPANFFSGKIALIDRGTCGFTIKTKFAQEAGAIAVLVADNAAGSPPPGLGGTDATIIIPAVRITLPDGNAIKAQLGTGVNVTIKLDNTVRAGADPFGRALLYTPNPIQSGSSVSHWDSSASPNQLMEPAINPDLSHEVTPNNDLTFSLMRDIGWLPSSIPSNIAVTTGNNQSTPLNQAFALPFSVATSPPTAGIGVTWTVNPNAGAAAAFPSTGTRSAVSNTDALGVAVAPPLTANGQAGTYSMNAAAPGAGTVAFAMTNFVLPDLTISKAHIGANFSQGQQGAQYTLTVTNASTADANGTITVTDTLPAGLSFASGTGTGWTCGAAGQLVTCSNPSTLITASGSSAITLAVNVANNAAATLDNSAAVACSCAESNSANNVSNVDSVAVALLPDLTISKAHVGTSFTQGQIGAQYTLTVNNAPFAASSGTITVTDTLPAGLTFVSGAGTGWACSATGQLVTCINTATPIAAGASSEVTLNVNVAGTAAASLSNSAAVACSCTESNITNNTSNTDTVSVNLAPDLTITKSHTGNFVQGQIGATYAMTVNNTGPGSKAAGATVTVTDTAPSALTITAMSGAGWTCATLPTCTRSDVLVAGASYAPITVTVTVAANASSPQINSVSVSTTAIEQDTANNSATDSTVVLVPPDMTVTKTHIGNFSQGQTGATYTVTVSNSGVGSKLAGDAVTVTDTPPSGLTITAMSGGGWTCTTLPTCTRSDLLIANASYPPITVTVSVAANATSPKINSVAVTTTALESDSSNNAASDSTVILVPPDLTISKSHIGNWLQGQTGATYASLVTNLGAGDKLAGAAVTVTDTPPPGLTITAMSGIGWTCTTLPSCTRSDLLGAGFSYPSLTITASVAGTAPSPLVNSITVSTTAFESSAANNTASDSALVITAPDLTVNKSHVGNFALGQIGAKYTVVVTNSGAGDKAGGSLVTLVDTPPSGLTITAISGAGWTCATLTSCTRSDALGSGVSYPPITVTVNVAAAATSPQVNAVSVTTTATESNAANNLGTDSTLIVTGTAGSLTVNKNGSGTGSVTSVDGGINCGATCMFGYVNGSNIVLTATPVAGSVFTGWLGPCTGTGACTVPINGAANVSATFALSSNGSRILDVDANAAYSAESDGTLILRYILGVRGSALTDGALGAGALRTGSPQMSAYLLDILPLLDVDGNGRVDAMTDGVMIVRKLLGLNGSVISAGVLGAGATRNAAEIDAYIQTLTPP